MVLEKALANHYYFYTVTCVAPQRHQYIWISMLYVSLRTADVSVPLIYGRLTWKKLIKDDTAFH